MIDAATRERWREMFRVATAGPWAHRYGRDVYSPLYTRPVVDGRLRDRVGGAERDRGIAEDHDLALVAASREGWPRTLDELEVTERRLERAKDELETMGAELRAARLLLAQVIEERDAARSERDSAVMARRASDAEMSAVTKHQTAYAARAEALFTAMRRWKRDRFAPALLQAWEEFNKPCA